MLEDKDDAAITTAIIVMAQTLNLNVVAEGVESKEQLDFLEKHNCHEIQGNYYYSPLSVEAISKLLVKQK